MASKNGKQAEVREELPFAPRTGDLPDLPEGQIWDSVRIGNWQFAIALAENMAGIESLCGGSEVLAARLVNRAARIDVPAKLDARAFLNAHGQSEEAAEVIQAKILGFDLSEIRPRAPRTPKAVTVPDQETFSNAEVRKMLQAQGVRVA